MLPDFNPEVVFGLHCGTAYEGAVGSQWKIDATQVSADVTVSSRLCISTDYYGVAILISENLYQACSKEFKSLMRPIDKVSIKGVPEP